MQRDVYFVPAAILASVLAVDLSAVRTENLVVLMVAAAHLAAASADLGINTADSYVERWLRILQRIA
jgi:hypothetical protein